MRGASGWIRLAIFEGRVVCVVNYRWRGIGPPPLTMPPFSFKCAEVSELEGSEGMGGWEWELILKRGK